MRRFFLLGGALLGLSGLFLACGDGGSSSAAADAGSADASPRELLDTTFGMAGVLELPKMPGWTPPEVRLFEGRDGRLSLVLRYFRYENSTSPLEEIVTVVRYMPDGGIDRSFAPYSERHDVNATSNEKFADGCLDVEGRLVLADYTFRLGAPDTSIVLKRLDASGTLDVAFGSAGVAKIDGFHDPAGPLFLRCEKAAIDVVTLRSTAEWAAEMVSFTITDAGRAGTVSATATTPLAGHLRGVSLGEGGAGLVVMLGLVDSQVDLVRIDSAGAVERAFGDGGAFPLLGFQPHMLAVDPRDGTVALFSHSPTTLTLLSKTGAVVGTAYDLNVDDAVFDADGRLLVADRNLARNAAGDFEEFGFFLGRRTREARVDDALGEWTVDRRWFAARGIRLDNVSLSTMLSVGAHTYLVVAQQFEPVTREPALSLLLRLAP